MQRRNIKTINPDEWPSIFAGLGLKPYASKQVFQWLFKKGISSFEEMTNLSKEARKILSDNFDISSLKEITCQEARDGTKKYLFELEDGEKIEAVTIPADDGRVTLCISSQVGCQLGCKFCRTADIGFKRDLCSSEIVDQVLHVSTLDRHVVRPGRTPRDDNGITNIVFMGMGEPLNNYENVAGAIKILSSEDGLLVARRRITISTAGIVPGILRMAKDKLGVKLAVSLNATTDEVRRKMMPVAKLYSIDEILSACKEYVPPGSRWRTTFEYVMIDGINDSIGDAKRLVHLMSRLPSKVNLIPYNPFPESSFDKSKEEVLKQFYNYLYNKGIQVNIRASKGSDILAACGQLAGG